MGRYQVLAQDQSVIFKSRFKQLDGESANRLAEQFGSPVYLYDIDGFERRFQTFQQLAQQHYAQSHVSISYKTNSTVALLQRLHRLTPWAEVVSSVEFELAARLKKDSPESIIFNGPAKEDRELATAIERGCQINIDHWDEIVRVENIATELGKKALVGIRVCLSTGKHFSRFGFAATEAADSEAHQAIEHVAKSANLELGGLQSHLGTNVRDLTRFRRQSEELATLANEIRARWSTELQWINVGGGLAGIGTDKQEPATTEDLLPCLKAYFAAVTEPLLPYINSCQSPPNLFFEPGRTIFDPFGALLLTVVGRRAPRETQLESVICNAGITSLPLAKQFRYPIHFFDDSSKTTCVDLIGPTCMQRDQLRHAVDAPPLCPGDHLLFYGVGGYCISTAFPFIKLRPAIIGWESDGQWTCLRAAETLDHVFDLHNQD